MSRRTIDLLFDDLTQQPIADGEGQTISFAFAGIAYQIDLTNENSKAFGEVMAPYIAAARRADLQPQLQETREQLKSPRARARVREWAAANGLEVAARGRIPDDVVTAYAMRAR
jgi:hypothetical protein